MQTVVFSQASQFETAVAVACHDAELTVKPEEALPVTDQLVLFLTDYTADKIASYLGRGFKRVYVVDYSAADDAVSTAKSGESIAVFPPSKIFSHLALERGLEVASFIDHFGVKFVPGYSAVIGDTSVERADMILLAIGGLGLSIGRAMGDIIEGLRTVDSLIEAGNVLYTARRVQILRAIAAATVVERAVPLAPGGETLYHPDGAACETFAAKVMHADFVHGWTEYLDTIADFARKKGAHYYCTRSAATNYALRLDPAAPSVVCMYPAAVPTVGDIYAWPAASQ